MAEPRASFDQRASADLPFIVQTMGAEKFVAIADDKKLYFGTDGDAWIRFNSTTGKAEFGGAIDIEFTDDIELADDKAIIFGTDNDASLKYVSADDRVAFTGKAFRVIQTVIAGAAPPPAFAVASGAHTTATASGEITDVDFDLSATAQRATGAVTLDRTMRVRARTLGFVGASTVTDAVTLNVSGPPIAGPNTTITRSWIATFGTLEATTTTPVAGVGIFGAGVTDLIIRNTTNDIEGRVSCSATIMEVTSASVRLGQTAGSVGFYGTTPIALQTGVAVTAGGVHAALVALGLITA